MHFRFFTENRFHCDCRLSWVFDLINRTKNIQLKRSLATIICKLGKHSNENTVNDNKFTHDTKHRMSPHFDNFGNDLTQQYQMTHQYDRQMINAADTQNVVLLNINVEQLPCEEGIDPTELPLSRESIGMDLSWLSGNAANMMAARFVLISCVALTVIGCLLS